MPPNLDMLWRSVGGGWLSFQTELNPQGFVPRIESKLIRCSESVCIMVLRSPIVKVHPQYTYIETVSLTRLSDSSISNFHVQGVRSYLKSESTNQDGAHSITQELLGHHQRN